MIKYHLPIILSSSTNSGALNKSENGSSFQVSLEKGLIIPQEAVYCWLVCQSAEIWNTSPNIKTGINDKLYVEDGMGVLLITIPQGLYDIPLLNAEIDRQMIAGGRPASSIIIIGNNATQKTFIQVLTIGTEINFTQPDTIRDILGFQSLLLVSTIVNELFTGTNVAAFNNIDFFILHTDLVSHGLRENNRYTQSVAQVLIEAPTGSQIIHQPDNPSEIPCNELIGSKKNIINVWLTDQDNNRIDTAGENFSLRVVIYYLMKII